MWLTDIKDALVVDIGGTSTDMGMLKNGFPREASTQREVCTCPAVDITINTTKKTWSGKLA